jgi:AcrR family transcriptional regulator
VTQVLKTKGEMTKQKLLDIAEEIFGNKGYYNTSVSEITVRSEVAMGTFYVYFPSKLEIYRELVQQLTWEIRHDIQQKVANLDNRLDVEREGFKAFFDYVYNNRNLYRIIREAEFVDLELFIEHYRKIATGYIKGLEAAMGKGQVRTIEAETVSYCLMGMAEFMGMRWVLWENRVPPEKEVDAMMDFIFYGIAPKR